ncbi:fatty acid--CoA ligase [Mesorhizobium sangaii]|uniref:Fatty-acyl-CoA synthase n=1 Tax=Mesorhizobium sangaii TaxID=505389 RepID=A0A841P2H9_9HYPH|nr:fatty acid--CoA ligase [Mesorhizobium sangaii]MBB6407781.1 fatty-acyl-CoA synthase [Mesorhizobium sangaii]
MTGRLIAGANSAYRYPLLIKQLWHTPLVQAPDQEIVYRDVRRFTYRQLRERIGRLASSLAGLGVAAGDTVGVLDWDSNRFLEAYFAVPMMGAVLQTVNVRLSPEQIAYTIDHAGPSVLLVNDDFVPVLEGIRQQLPKVKTLIVMSDRAVPQTGSLSFAGEYEHLLAGASADYDFPDFDEDTLATTFYTSGTTGKPKGVNFSHRQLVLHTLAQMAFLGTATKQGRFGRDDVYMPMTPMFHAHAWGLPWTATLSGAKQVYPGRYDPHLLVKLIKTEGVTVTHGVPTILQMLLGAATAANTDLAGLKMAVGGSELPKALARQALALGVDVYAGYGMSETAPLLSLAQVRTEDLTADVDRQLDIRTMAGISAPLVDLRLVDRNRDEAARDGKTTGEIVVRAPWLTQGYAGDPEASEQLWSGGYLHTGDIGVIDAGGYLRVVDRIKDVIKSGGEWVSSLQIEDLISQCEGVSEAAVIGIKDEKWGERPLALVIRNAKTGSELSDIRIMAHLKSFADSGVISKVGIPDKILFVDTLPRTSVGKFDKKQLRATYGNMAVVE